MLDSICKTQYPIVMVHGVGLRDNRYIRYWGNIPKALKDKGAIIYFGGQDAWGTIEENAYMVKSRIQKIITETGIDKVNLIAHSKGGLEMRYMISELDMGKHIASLTTISTPHHGLKMLDLVFKGPNNIYKFVSGITNLIFKLMGDKKPDFYQACFQMTSNNCRVFNSKYMDDTDVFYQSYASHMKHSLSDPKFFLTHFIIKRIEGESDGMVSIDSAKWGEYKGLINSDTGSHSDVIGFRVLKKSKPNIQKSYQNIIEYLKLKGF